MVQISNTRSSSRSGRKALEKRRQILRAAARAFRRHGFAQTGMREIAREADLSPGNLYYYFRSKDALLCFCQEQALAQLLSAAEEIAESEAAPGDKLRMLVAAHVRTTLDELDGAAAHVAVDALPEALRGPVVRQRDEYEQRVRELIEAGVAAGAFVPCDPALITRAILGALNWTVQWYRPEGLTPSGEVARGFAEYLVRGLEVQQ